MILLITGCVQVEPDIPYLVHTDKEIRLKEYLKTLSWAGKEDLITGIVFCENSGCTYDFMKYMKKKACAKAFEYLTFRGKKSETKMFGKGYGEGEIVRYALENSLLLKDASTFAKLTGRLTVHNLSQLSIKQGRNYFMNYKYSDAVDTRFYIAKQSDFKKYLLDSYKKVRDRSGKYLEVVYYQELMKNHVKYKSFRMLPVVAGRSGTLGMYYRPNVSIGDELLCVSGLYNSVLIKYIRNFTYNVIEKSGSINRRQEFKFIDRNSAENKYCN